MDQLDRLLIGKSWRIDQLHTEPDGSWKCLFETLPAALVMDFFRSNTLVSLDDKLIAAGEIIMQARGFDEVVWTYRLSVRGKTAGEIPG